MVLSLCLGVAALTLLPVATLFLSSVRVEVYGEPTHFSLSHFGFFFGTPRMLRSLGNTLVLAAGTTVVAGTLGLALAWLHGRTNVPWRHGLEVLSLVPFFLSPYVGAVAWTYLASPRVGLLNVLARDLFGAPGPLFNIYSRWGMIWVLAIFFTPLMYLFVVEALRRADPALEEAARVSGSGPWETTRRVTLRLVTPGVLSGALIVFVSSAGEFGVPLALGSPFGVETLTTQIYALTQGYEVDYNRAAAVAVVLASVTVLLIFVQRRLIERGEFVTVTGKGYRPALVDLGHAAPLALALNLAYILVAVVLPLAALVLVSLSRVWTGRVDPGAATLANYAYVFRSGMARTGMAHSVILAGGGATLGVVLGFAVAYLVHRRGGGVAVAVDFITTIPVGFPGIVLAMGVLIAFLRTPLYGTLGLFLLGYLVRFMPYGQRTVSSLLVALSPELDQCSRVAGASWFGTLRRILVPLLKPGLLGAWLLLFILYLREFPISALLYKGGLEVLSVALWLFVENETAPRAAALALVQVAILLVLVALVRRVVGIEKLTA
ncbi:MAG TPA: iron ABC transporter permease [Candidatus Methylomirabilis sp.]